MIEIDELVNKTITNLLISYVEPDIAKLMRRPTDLGQTTTLSTSPWEILPQTTGGDMMGRRLEQGQVQVETLVAVLLIEDGETNE